MTCCQVLTKFSRRIFERRVAVIVHLCELVHRSSENRSEPWASRPAAE